MEPVPTSEQTRYDSGRIATRALRQVDVGPGRSFLDVRAEDGDLSILAALTGAQVTAIDASPTLVRRLNQRARTEGLDIDAHVMADIGPNLDDDSFDVVSSSAPISNPADGHPHLDEMTRVTRPGGQVQIVTPPATGEDRLRNLLEDAGLTEIRVITERVDVPHPDGSIEPTELRIAIGTKPPSSGGESR